MADTLQPASRFPTVNRLRLRIRAALSGNSCRCTGSVPIVAAVLEARAAYRMAAQP